MWEPSGFALVSSAAGCEYCQETLPWADHAPQDIPRETSFVPSEVPPPSFAHGSSLCCAPVALSAPQPGHGSGWLQLRSRAGTSEPEITAAHEHHSQLNCLPGGAEADCLTA